MLFSSSGGSSRHGFFAKIGTITGISAAFVGGVLNGKRALTAGFVEKMADYLNLSVLYLMGEQKGRGPWDKEQAGEDVQQLKDYLELYKLAPIHLKNRVAGLIQMSFHDAKFITDYQDNNIDLTEKNAINGILDEAKKNLSEHGIWFDMD